MSRKSCSTSCCKTPNIKTQPHQSPGTPGAFCAGRWHPPGAHGAWNRHRKPHLGLRDWPVPYLPDHRSTNTFDPGKHRDPFFSHRRWRDRPDCRIARPALAGACQALWQIRGPCAHRQGAGPRHACHTGSAQSARRTRCAWRGSHSCSHSASGRARSRSAGRIGDDGHHGRGRRRCRGRIAGG